MALSLQRLSLQGLSPSLPGLQGPVATMGTLLIILGLILLAALVVAIWK